MKQAIIEYVKEYYEKHKKVPSIRNLIKHFKISFNRFYDLFPDGLPEACRLAGVSVPKERIKRVEKAREASKQKETAKGEAETAPGRIVLTEELTKRLLGISHLEKGMDPQLIIERLIENDTVMRRTHKLSFNKVKAVWDFLEAAVKRGWSTNSSPNIVDFVTNLWNAGVGDLSPEMVKALTELVAEIKRRKWTIPWFVNEVTNAHNAIIWWQKYKAGIITAEEFNRKVDALT